MQVALVQDAAESLGSTYQGTPAGGQGALAAFSFNGNKIITTSGGGMLVSDDGDRIEHARKLSTQAREDAPHYQHTELGFNYRMSNILAALGRAQLELLPERIAVRRQLRDRYRDHLSSLPGVSFLPESTDVTGNAWLTCILINPEAFGTDRETVRLALEAEDIESRPLWKPMHLQPYYASQPIFGGEVSGRLFARGLCLPSGSALEPGRPGPRDRDRPELRERVGVRWLVGDWGAFGGVHDQAARRDRLRVVPELYDSETSATRCAVSWASSGRARITDQPSMPWRGPSRPRRANGSSGRCGR